LQSARYWRATGDWKPALTVAATVALACVALRASARSAFAVAVGAYLALAAVQAMGTLAFWTSAPRTLYPLGVCSIAALVDWEASRPPGAVAGPDGVARGSATGANVASGTAQHALQ